MEDATRDQALRAAAEALGRDENAANIASALDETVTIHEEEPRTILTKLAGFLRAVRIKAGL